MENEFLRLKEVMAEKDITGKTLAERLGIRPATISDIVTGRSQPRFELLAKIADELGVEMRDLFKSSKLQQLYIKKDGQLQEVGTLNIEVPQS